MLNKHIINNFNLCNINLVSLTRFNKESSNSSLWFEGKKNKQTKTWLAKREHKLKDSYSRNERFNWLIVFHDDNTSDTDMD